MQFFQGILVGLKDFAGDTDGHADLLPPDVSMPPVYSLRQSVLLGLLLALLTQCLLGELFLRLIKKLQEQALDCAERVTGGSWCHREENLLGSEFSQFVEGMIEAILAQEAHLLLRRWMQGCSNHLPIAACVPGHPPVALFAQPLDGSSRSLASSLGKFLSVEPFTKLLTPGITVCQREQPPHQAPMKRHTHHSYNQRGNEGVICRDSLRL